jgi:beta-glucosidase
VARKSIVLLKNDGILPLDKAVGTIAVIGPLADDKDAPLGNWRGRGEANSAVSLLEGVKAAVSPGTKVIYAEGAKLITGQRSFPTPSVYNTSDRSGFPAAVKAALSADVVLLAIGEDAFQSGEGRSQADLGLKGLQNELFRAVVEANKRVVVVLMSGRPLVVGDVADAVPALVETWFLGSQSGHAIADVLFGGYNPSGKLPVSFPRMVGQVPVYYGHKSTGRPGPEPGVTWSHYTDVSNDPLYPFGFGLSYTTFTYSEPTLSAPELAAGGQLKVSVTVTNSGRRAGSEIAQLYVRDLVGSVTRPVKELKGFERVELGPGQSRDVTFTITPADLAFYTAAGRWESEPGAFKVFVGGNSRDVKEASFTLR